MNDSVSKLKEILFDRESAELSELRANIKLVAEAERRSHDELIELVHKLDEGLSRKDAELGNRVQNLDDGQRLTYSELNARLEPLLRRTATPEAWRSSVAEVLDDAIVEARETRHVEMTRAVAPLVVKTVQTELRNSEDTLVQMLYPRTGEMVQSFVASAMRDLVNQINRRLEMNPTMLRIRSWASGYSMAELVLAETQRLEISELFLIRRGSGALLQRWPSSPMLSNSDIHLSGVLTAINDFSSHAFQHDGGNLRSFNLDESTVFLRASPVYLLAAKCRGTAIRGVEGLIDTEFVDVVSRQHDIEGQLGGVSSSETTVPSNLLAALKDRLESGIGERHERISRAGLPFNPLKALALLLGLAILSGGGWWAWTNYESAVVRNTARGEVEKIAALNVFPIDLSIGWRGRTLDVSGFAPSLGVKTELERNLKAALPEAAIKVDRVAVLAVGPDLTPQLTEVQRDLASLTAELDSRGIRRSLDRAAKRLEQMRPELQRLAALPDVDKRQVAVRSTTAIDEALLDLTRHRQSVIAAGYDVSRLAPLQASLEPIVERLQRAASELSVLVGGASPPPIVPRRAGPPPSLLESAEEAGLAAERVATIATAAVQASAIKIPEVTKPTARERLQAFVKTHAIFFGDSDVYRAPDKANETLDQLVKLMNETTTLVRVVGYTDERGGTGRNAPLSQSRADKVAQALIARGVARSRFSVVGRANGNDLSPSVGPQSPNRRVEFEVGFEDETGIDP